MAARRRRKTNKQLLVDRLYRSFVDRVEPDEARAQKTGIMQGQAHHFADELEALSRGAGECRHHPDLVEGACPRCAGLWSDDG